MYSYTSSWKKSAYWRGIEEVRLTEVDQKGKKVTIFKRAFEIHPANACASTTRKEQALH